MTELRPLSAASGEQAHIDARLRAELDCALAGGMAPPQGLWRPPMDGTPHPAHNMAAPAPAAPGHAPGHVAAQPQAPAPTTNAWTGAGGDRGPTGYGGEQAWQGTGPGTGGEHTVYMHATADRPPPPPAGVAGGPAVAPPARPWQDHDGRERSRRRSNRSVSPPRRKRRRDQSSSSESSEDDDTADRREEYRMTPLRARGGAAPADLRLPAVTTKAARQLRNRRNYVAVRDAADPVEPSPNNVLEYIGRVAAIVTHTTYYFPQCGLQATSYLTWLISRSAGRSLRDVQTADSRARQAMALRPRDFLTTLDLDQFWPTRVASTATTAERAGTNHKEVCFQHVRRNKCTTPCRTGRIHPPCQTCNSTQHATAFHAAFSPRGTAGWTAADQQGDAQRGRSWFGPRL
ncbi:uncharacterized protein LOC122386316 [Amphibalanus amphitrite]|uniref:uncharacterized protein LOC122386316 n=1 Tax=Amphibalanus amphitrite TaxID=1232801 RepID=UPI001C91269E|nr:uncharacterized protein LOC122386316 [Amphibalanus amphitrite]